MMDMDITLIKRSPEVNCYIVHTIPGHFKINNSFWVFKTIKQISKIKFIGGRKQKCAKTNSEVSRGFIQNYFCMIS